jgi:hypothetical protein
MLADYVRLLKYGDSLYRCKELKRAALVSSYYTYLIATLPRGTLKFSKLPLKQWVLYFQMKQSLIEILPLQDGIPTQNLQSVAHSGSYGK